MINITSPLTDPIGQPLAFAEVSLVCLKTATDILANAKATTILPESGILDISVPVAHYEVLLLQKGVDIRYRIGYLNLDDMVDGDAYTLEGLLVSDNPLIETEIEVGED